MSYSSDLLSELKELYYTQVYYGNSLKNKEELNENVFKSPSKPAASAAAAKNAAQTHKTVAAAATNADARRSHRDAAAGYEVTARRMRMTADHYEFLSDYLINENFASDLNAAYAIIENMSDEWLISIFEENLNEVTGFGRVAFRLGKEALRRGMYASRGMKFTPFEKNRIKMRQLGSDIQRSTQSNDGPFNSVKELGKAEERYRRLQAVNQSPGLIRSSKNRGWWGAPPPERGYGSK